MDLRLWPKKNGKQYVSSVFHLRAWNPSKIKLKHDCDRVKTVVSTSPIVYDSFVNSLLSPGNACHHFSIFLKNFTHPRTFDSLRYLIIPGLRISHHYLEQSPLSIRWLFIKSMALDKDEIFLQKISALLLKLFKQA